MTIIKRIEKIFDGSERTKMVKRNIAGSFLIKGLGIITSLLLVPVTINLLNQEKYGIWMTIFSIVSWFNMMDVGIGNGFRNKFAEAIAVKDKKLAKEYVQMLYSSMAIIATLFLVIFSALNSFLNWHSILNLKKDFNENISLIVLIVFTLFCIQLYTKNISTLLLAIQKTAVSSALGLYANILACILIFILKFIGQTSLLSIALAFMLAPVVVNIVYTIKYFASDLVEYRPKLIATPRKKYLNDIMGLGLKFFIIQITTIVIFSSANILITQLFGPSEVTPYNVAFRFYSSIQGIFTILVTPFWSAFTEANARLDYTWIKKSIRKLMKVWFYFSLGVILVWLISPVIFKLWVGAEVVIPFYLSLQFALYVIVATWTTIFVCYINGVGKIKLQLIIALIQLVINIPLAIYLSRNLNFGLSGIILATNISLILPAVFIPIQYKKIITNSAHGIWTK